MSARIVRLVDEGDWRRLLPQVEDIFFTTSTVQTFSDEEERTSFKERWLGRYLDHFIESFFVALDEEHTAIGYLAGCLENPALDPRFDDLEYYREFGPLCAAYPAHLHINVAPRLHNRGTGTALIAAFGERARLHGAPGLHVVTNKGARNVRFYERNGFRVLATARPNEREIVFMGSQLD